MKKHHKVQKVAFADGCMTLKVDGREYKFPLVSISERLAGASSVKREKYEIMPSGYGIHWPLLDEDLSIDALINTKRRQVRKSG
jgi:hypothetical protein